MRLKKVNPAEKSIRTALLSDLKNRMQGWRQDHTGKQISKLRKGPEPKEEPVPFAKGGVVDEGKDEEGADDKEALPSQSNSSAADEVVKYAEKIDGGASDGEDAADDESMEDEDDSGNDSEPEEKEESIEDMIRKLSRGK